jgi:long-chain acyl-CoA synthetase
MNTASPVAAAGAASPVDLDQMSRLGDIPRLHASRRPEATAISFEGRHVTYAELDRRADRVAVALAADGVRPGHRVAYLGKNCDRYFELLFGCARAGAVLTPISWRLSAAEIAYVLEHAGAVRLFVGPDAQDLAREAVAALPAPLPLLSMDGEGAGAPSYGVWRDAAPDVEVSTGGSPEDVVVQLYTSGTTGRPKGAMLTHRSLLEVWREGARAGLTWNAWDFADVSLVTMPLSHVGGTAWGLASLFFGARAVVAREFEASRVLALIEGEGVTRMFLVPAALQLVLREPRVRQADFRRLKTILYGASPIPLDLLRECLAVFGCGFVQQYGMTETSGTIVHLPPEDHDPAGTPRMRAAGKAMPGVELKVVDEAGADLAPFGVGEVVTRSRANMAGYWRQPEATATTIDPEGWLRTGDAGYLDADGYLFIQDRVKDMIISGGENIYPAEVENAVYGHPAVAEVAVIGVPDPVWGEAVKAMVVLKPGVQADPQDIIAFARGRTAAFKAPKTVDFVDSLPRNPSGKVLRRELRAPFWVGRERAVN